MEQDIREFLFGNGLRPLWQIELATPVWTGHLAASKIGLCQDEVSTNGATIERPYTQCLE